MPAQGGVSADLQGPGSGDQERRDHRNTKRRAHASGVPVAKGPRRGFAQKGKESRSVSVLDPPLAAARSQLTMLPKIIKPMLAQTAQGSFDSEEHLFEIKWDGIRCVAFVETGVLRLQSRQGIEMTRQFPELSSLHRLLSGTVLDGELV